MELVLMNTMKMIFLFFVISFFGCTQEISVHNEESVQNKVNSIKRHEFLISGINISNNFPKQLLGAFGRNYYRIDLRVDTIEKKTDSLYIIYGSTELKNNVQKFLGTIELVSVSVDSTDIYGQIDSNEKYGILNGTYNFFETNGRDTSGIFNGKIKIGFHVNIEDGSVDFDLLDWMQSSYLNYEMIGFWNEYGKERKYKTYFSEGHMNIDLDGGAGEFCPKQKYRKYGWDSFIKEYFEDN